MTYAFIKQNGYKFILCKPDGTIKAFGNSREVVAYSRQRKPEDRIYTLRDMGYWPYVMIYDKAHASTTHKRLARWVNMRSIFAKVARFEDYR